MLTTTLSQYGRHRTRPSRANRTVRRRGIRGGLISTLKRDHPRKVYKLTRVGRRVLDAEVERLHDLVAAAQLRTAGVDA